MVVLYQQLSKLSDCDFAIVRLSAERCTDTYSFSNIGTIAALKVYAGLYTKPYLQRSVNIGGERTRRDVIVVLI